MKSDYQLLFEYCKKNGIDTGNTEMIIIVKNSIGFAFYRLNYALSNLWNEILVVLKIRK